MNDSYFQIIFLQSLASVLPYTAPTPANHWISQECCWTVEEVPGMCSQSPAHPDGSGCSAAVHGTRIPLLSISFSIKGERVEVGRGNLGDEREKQEQKDELEGLWF